MKRIIFGNLIHPSDFISKSPFLKNTYNKERLITKILIIIIMDSTPLEKINKEQKKQQQKL